METEGQNLQYDHEFIKAGTLEALVEKLASIDIQQKG